LNAGVTIVNCGGRFMRQPNRTATARIAAQSTEHRSALHKRGARTVPAPVAQWIEQRFPKPQVACSIHAGGA